jgi:very-short-patch-repair endonuclease
MEKPVEVSSDVFSNDDILRQLRDALSRQASGKSAFVLLTSLGQGQIKRIHAGIRIDSGPVDRPEAAQHALAYLEWRATVKELYRRWNQLALELNLPPLDRDDDAVGRWAADARNKIAMQVAAARNHLPTATEELRVLFPFGLSLDDLENIDTARRARNALELNLSRQRLEASRVKLQDARSRLANVAGNVVERMRIFVDEVVGSDKVTALAVAERWEALLRELKYLRELAPQLATVQSIAKKVSASGAPKWAEQLVREPVDGQEDRLTPDDWRATWLWAQQEHFLNAIGNRTQLSALTEQRQVATEDLERIFRGVVRDRTFLMLTQTLTDRVRAALVMFGSAIRQIGAGTGIRARRFRRDAREAMDSCYSAVPCWIMPTWRVSENLPSIPGSFDLVIIDEASQSDVLALPAILRGKKVLVVGDDKQVSPVAVAVEEKKILQLRHNYLTDQPFAAMMVPGRSLYDLMSAVFPGQRTMLREHFRCVEPIIRFSAREFYDNQIRPLRIPKASERLDPPLVDIFVDHGWKEGKVNLPEARVIVDEIEKVVSDPAFRNRTIGVVSLIGANQAQKIQNMLLERIGEETFLHHQIACGDSATFQGKERDIMFVSMVAGANDTRALTGLMYEQRFNVALSRARDRMYLVRSVDDALLKPHDLKARVIRHFQNPMEGAPVDAVDGIALCESDFEREVYRKLVERGWRVRPQVKASDYRIDLVVEGANDRRLAIELDGDKYHGPERWAEDYRRQLALERMGWRFWRCWGSSWTLDPVGCLADLESTLKSLGIEPLGGEWVPARYTEHRIVSRPDVSKAGSVDEALAGEPSSLEEDMDGAIVRFDRLRSRPSAALGEEAGRPAPHTDGPNGREPGAFLYDEERVVEVGDKVVIAYNDDPGTTRTLILSASEKDDPKTGIIYIGRPIAQALLGQAEQEIVELPAGQNAREATILRIEKGAVAA